MLSNVDFAANLISREKSFIYRMNGFLMLSQTSVPKLYLHFIESGYWRRYDKYVNEIILNYFLRRKKKWKLLDRKVVLRRKFSVSEVTCQGW